MTHSVFPSSSSSLRVEYGAEAGKSNKCQLNSAVIGMNPHGWYIPGASTSSSPNCHLSLWRGNVERVALMIMKAGMLILPVATPWMNETAFQGTELKNPLIYLFSSCEMGCSCFSCIWTAAVCLLFSDLCWVGRLETQVETHPKAHFMYTLGLT